MKKQTNQNPDAFTQAMNKAKDFLKAKFDRQGQFLRVSWNGRVWITEIEVIEPSVYMIREGIPNPVLEKNQYEIVLDEELKVLSFQKLEPTVCECEK